MFTGLIEEVGKITKLLSIPGGKRVTIQASKILDDLKIDHSVAVSGICLTAIEIEKKSFTAEAVGETLEKSILQKMKINTPVNLERAMKLNDRLGGHFVQGHVSGIGNVSRIEKRGANWLLEIILPSKLMRYIIPEGSIAIDGISLTIADIINDRIRLSIISHTYKNTIVSYYRIGQYVNIEVDFFAKYIEKYLADIKITSNNNSLSKEWLKKNGY